VGIIVPWNFPMPIAGWGWLPRSRRQHVVLKPAELTPLTAIRLGELALQAGLPPDVLTVLPGKGRSSASASSPTRWSARSASPARPRSASASWPAAPRR
jgi:acyl-CoA reductase-like NAD-dependent aldehyde dehydrogenase